MLRVRVRQFGDAFVVPFSEPTTTGSSITLINHRTRLDWIYIWCLGSFPHYVKIVLKAELGKLPGILMFPEGTNLCPESIVSSDSYAKKTGRPLLRYTLHPRLTGFQHFVKNIGSRTCFLSFS
ncbi:unnamed protein product [Dibothriocephalus latus]|uniref:Phospholipid/glycerol acyltransferase domain-containing protein n=1 Tax=Dibothriocephalus latus TaxID=60516 RepID=A0A3P7NTB3_DIBLA|nr:unnamed protein product [Dibothriocephalus latus]